MSVDIATLGIKVDATEVNNADRALDKLADTGARTESATRKFTSATAEFDKTVRNTSAAISGNVANLTSQASATNAATAATAKAASAAGDLADRVARLKASVDPLGAAQDRVNAELAEAEDLYARGAITAMQYADAQATLLARTNTLQGQQDRHNAIIRGTASASRLSASEMLNLSRQAQDLGVSFAMGMNPLMVFAQQGPQIFDILSTRASLAGTSISTVFKELGVTIWTALAPVLPIIAGIGLAVGAVAAAFAIGTHEINSNVGDVAKGMGLTEKQLDRLKEKGVSTTVTLGDTFKAFFQVTGDRLQSAFAGPLKWLGDAFKATYEFVRDAGYTAIKAIVGGFTGAFYAIKATWAMLPAAIGDLAISAANGVISAVESMVNGAINRINALAGLANKVLPEAMQIGKLGNVSMGQIGNPYAGQARATGAAASAAFGEGYQRGAGAVDSFVSDVQGRAVKNRQAAIRKAAGDDGAGRAAGGASDAARDEERKAKAAEDFAKALREETENIGKNRIELKMMAAERAAMAAPTAALATEIRNAADAWKAATIADETSKLKRELGDLNEAAKFENSLLGMNAEARAVANAEREIELRLRALERQGIDVNADAIRAETEAYIANARAKGQRQDMADGASAAADAIGRMNSNLQAATSAFGDMFGTAGKGFAELVGTLGDYYQFQADQEARLAEVRARYGDQSREYLAAEMEAREAATAHELDTYGRVLGGVKSLFSQKSAAYKVAEAAEKAYAAVRLALALKEIIMETTKTATHVGGAAARMATDGVETASSVSKSGIRAAADGVAAIAKAIASLPFPLNIAAGAATAAALVAFGVKVFGGGGKKSASAEMDKATTAPAYSGPVDEYGQPTSSYSVLRSGKTTVAGANDNGGITVGTSGAAGGGTVTNAPTYHINIEGNADERTVQQLREALTETEDRAVQRSREAVAADNAARSNRQRIGGGR